MQKNVYIKRRVKRRKVCAFCANKWDVLDYKEVEKYRKFLTDRGKIYPRRNSGICAKHQRMLAQAVKRARIICLIPNCVD